jgi:hypothetical protein
MVKDIFERLGGAVVVSTLMDVDYDTAWKWEKKNAIPARRRIAFIAMCKRHGITVTLQQLAGVKK